MNISPARLASFEILTRIERDKAFSAELLPVYEEKMGEKDRALCHQLTLGTLRQQIFLDTMIGNFVTQKLDLEVRIALRLGIYQICRLDRIPLYSAINESVNLVQKAKKTSAKGLVNAVLRKISNEKIQLKFSDKIEQISIETSHPRWLIEKWISQFGLEQTEKLAEANNEIPNLDYRFTLKTTDSLKTSLKREKIVNEKNFLRELAENGKIYFQDKASQLVALLVDLKANERFLDVCCAPASKFSLIAQSGFQNDETNLMIGGDLSLPRLLTAKHTCQKQGLKNFQLLQFDAEKSLPLADESFAAILVDAPCSGTGTIRHNPEIRYFLKENDFAELSSKQLNILTNASKLVKRGGRLIYSTCSLEVEENEEVIERFLLENRDFQKAKLNLQTQFLTDRGFGRTFPQRDKMDGFFIATLEKC